MIIIWGSRGLTSQVDSGEFYCPNCDKENTEYVRKQIRPWFTLYFIPLFPCGSADRYIECKQCRGTYTEAVLDMEPPTPVDRLLRHSLESLALGTSIEDVEEQMSEAGIDRQRARLVLEELTRKTRVWECDRCGHHFVREVKQCSRCR